MVQVIRVSVMSGKTNSMEINTTEAKINAWMGDKTRPLIQNYFPELTADEREFLISGSTPEEWDKLFLTED